MSVQLETKVSSSTIILKKEKTLCTLISVTRINTRMCQPLIEIEIIDQARVLDVDFLTE